MEKEFIYSLIMAWLIYGSICGLVVAFIPSPETNVADMPWVIVKIRNGHARPKHRLFAFFYTLIYSLASWKHCILIAIFASIIRYSLF